MFRSTSTSLIVRGVLATIIGIIAVAWAGVTILTLVLLFAVYAPRTLSPWAPGHSAASGCAPCSVIWCWP